jgi:hypothetical protein
MKTFKPLWISLVLCILQPGAKAQSDTVKIAQKALFFADSLVKAETYKNWSIYTELSVPSVIKYYGGKSAFIETIQRGSATRVSSIEEESPKLTFLFLSTKNEEWQCVIRESRYIHRDDKKLHIVTYFVGQSIDAGDTWRLFDVAYNKVANIIYMMPDIFDLPIPEHTVLTEEEEIALAKTAEPPAQVKTSGHSRKKG